MRVKRFAGTRASISVVLAWMVWLTLGLSRVGWAAPPDDWEVMRVFIRDDPEQISRLVTSHYATVLLDDLARELAEHSNRRKVTPLETPALEEAIYIARLEEETLISDQSRWKLSGPDSTQPVELGSILLALRTARGISSGELQLTDRVQFSASGGVELPLATNDRVYWFGFSMASLEQGAERVFRLRLPPAVNSKLLLSTPSNVNLHSPTVVVEKIPSLANQLPEDWSVSSLPSFSTASQWWLVHLSGVGELELSVSQNADNRLTWYKHLVRTAVIDYVGDDRQMEVSAQFVVAGQQAAPPLRLWADRELKIETVLVDGLPVPWRVEPSLTEDSTLIAMIDLKSSTQDRRIEVHANSAPLITGLAKVPQIAVAEAYTLDGKSRLSGSNGWVADTLLAAGKLAGRGKREQAILGPVANNAELERLVWESSWLGSPPELQAQFSRQRLPAQARSLTRFSVQTEWLNANCRIRIDAPHVRSNEIRLPVGSGWFIDSVRLIGAESDFGARVEDREGADSPMIVIHWEGNRRHIAMELEVIAHIPRESNAETVSLLSPRLVTLPQADQIDNYAVEQSSRFAVQVSAKLLPYQRQSFELPVWQQELLRPTTETWIFQGVRGSIPPITLIASSGTYSSQVWSVLRLLPAGGASLTSRIRCTPASGSIDRIRLTIPAGFPLDDWSWSLQNPDEVEESVQLKATHVVEINEGPAAEGQAEQLVELELPSPMTSEFTLSCDVPLKPSPAATEINIPVIGLAAATRGESILLIPRQLASGLEQLPAEVLTASALQQAPEWAELNDLIREDHAAWVAARMDASLSQLLRLPLPQQGLRGGWAWSELVQHTIQDNGQIDHHLQWFIEGRGNEPLEVKLPLGWQVERIDVDGVLVESPQAASTVQLELPSEGRTMLTMRCVSRHKQPRWLSFYPLQCPTLSLPVLAERVTLAIPPTRLAAQRLSNHWMPADASRRLVDRLLPTTLWRLLAPTTAEGDSSFDAQRLPAGWSLIELSSDNIAPWSASTLFTTRTTAADPGEWIISRSALSAISLAVVLIVACGLWVALGSSPLQWWLVATMCVMTVVMVPSWLLAPAQLVLLALCLAVLLRLCAAVNSWRSNSPRPQGRSSVLRPAAPVNTTALLALCCLSGAAAAQSSNQAGGTESSPAASRYGSTSDSSETPSPPEIFSVLIPIDEAGEVAGGYAYAPTRLLELLAGGGDGSTRPAAPKILSADYTLRLRRGLASGPDQIQELSVEFRLQVAQTDVELRLPFNNSQLQLQRGSVGGQELFVGGRWLSQLPDAVVFRASSTGSQRLQLQFELRNLAVDETVANLQCAIPPIPNATLRIVADSSSNFEIRSSGSGRKVISSVSTELLGPTSVLDIQWSPASPRGNGSSGQVAGEFFADTWLHARGEQVTAVCQLRIENAGTLPRDLHIMAEPGWEPVGTDWENGDLVSSELSTLGGRRVYTIRSHPDWEQTSRRVLRVVMVPRDPQQISALAIPFFSLREVSQQTVTRTLAWTTEANAVWRPDGLDLWPELTSVPGLEWGQFGWSPRPQLYRLMGMLAATLRRVTPSTTATIDEMTQVHLARGELRLNYRGQFSVPQILPRSLVIPRQARVDSLLVDGSPRDYRISERENQAIIEVLAGDTSTTHRSVEVVLSQPLTLGQLSRFPRVFARDFQSTRSIYRVLCGVGLECKVAAHDALSLTTANIPAHELLPALETPVGQIDLGEDYRDQPYLPLEFEVQRSKEAPLQAAVMALKRSEQGWRATVTAVWDTQEKPLDFAFFELPVGVRDSVDPGQLPAQLTPLGDSGRMTLRLLPAAPVSGKTKVEFAFSLPMAVSTQTVSLPDVAILSEIPQTPLLALPSQIDGQTVQWSGVGRRVEELPASLSTENLGDAYQFFEIEPNRSQVSWKRFEAETRSASLLLSHLTLLSQQPSQIAGYIDYWIAPQGQLKLSLDIPQQCQVLGVEIAERPAIWSQHNTQLSVLLQPNYLPLNVRILLHWNLPQSDSLGLQVPRILNAAAADRTLEFVENQLPAWHVQSAATTDAQQLILQDFSQHWVQSLLETLQGSRARPSSETLAWLEQWHPRHLGLPDHTEIDSEAFSEMVVALDADEFVDWPGSTAEELWQQAWQIAEDQQPQEANATAAVDASAEVHQPRSSPAFYAGPATWPSQYVRLTPQQQVLVINKIVANSSWTSRWMAASLLLATSLLVLFLATRLAGRYFQLLSLQPWVYWLQLAAVAWWLLPLAWPSWVLALAAVGMLVAQWFETRRRQRLLARV